jgi:hypothetical protein
VNFLDWPAMLTALIGTFILSRRAPSARMRRLAFFIYLVSNLLWLAWACHLRAYPMIIMQLGFLYTSIDGIRNALKDLAESQASDRKDVA